MIRRSTATALSAVTVSALLAAGCGGSSAEKDAQASAGLGSVSPEVQKAAKAFKGPFKYWIGLTFPESSNELEQKRIEAWGKKVGVDVEIVKVNQNEIVQQVSGAVEAGTLPTALTVPYDLVQTLGPQGQLVPVDDAYAKIGSAHGGWLESIDKASKAPSFAGKVYGVPFGFFGNVLFRRTDLLKTAGFTEAPKTWEELASQGAKAAKPPKTYGLGFALSNVLDGNLTTSMMQAWGGRVADDAGKKCTIASPQTEDFLTWVKTQFDAKAFPPGAVTWDGAGDNNSYLAGQSVFIANTGSVYLSMKEDDPDLAADTKYSALPAGPKMQVSPVDPRYRVIPTTTSPEGQVLAQDLFDALADDTYMAEYMANATYGPVLKSQLKYPVYSQSPVHQGLLELAEKGTAPAYPDTANAAYSDYQNAFSTPRMVQRVVVDHVPPKQAMADAQAACQKIYDKHAS
jgi:multiple sugar transport system substrate-binding protein